MYDICIHIEELLENGDLSDAHEAERLTPGRPNCSRCSFRKSCEFIENKKGVINEK